MLQQLQAIATIAACESTGSCVSKPAHSSFRGDSASQRECTLRNAESSRATLATSDPVFSTAAGDAQRDALVGRTIYID